MSAYADTLRRFQAGVLRGVPGAETLADIATHPAMPPARQFAVYADAYRLRLVAALRADYPALRAAIGEEAFTALARDFVAATPSRHFNLDRYGAGFAGFLATRLPGAAAELARLEAAIARVFIAADSAALDPAALADMDGAALAALVLQPRGAALLLTLAAPLDAWLGAQRRGAVMPLPGAGFEHLYVYRHDNEVRRVALPPAAHTFLHALIEGRPIGIAAEQAPDAGSDVPGWLREWIVAGFFRA